MSVNAVFVNYGPRLQCVIRRELFMFERYTEKARRTIFFGRYEASQFGSPYIESEHLLLGLLREDKSLANTFLSSHGTVESVRKQVEARTVIRQKISTSVDLPLSNECKRILAYATEEADKFTHKFVGTGHLFLGVLREYDCFAAKLLRERGVALEMARVQIGSNPPEQPGHSPKSPGLPAGYTSPRLLYHWAAETLVLELRTTSRFLLPTRLFVRRKGTEAYEQIGNPAEDVSYESPVICESYPVVVFNSLKRGKGGADWDGIYSYHLDSKELKLCISPQTLRLSEAHGRLWIAELISLSEDAQTLCVNIGVEKSVSGGTMHYYLAKVELRDQQVSLLSRLLDTRF
jgi:Clp amino terminal domain, pathogenicity island component